MFAGAYDGFGLARQHAGRGLTREHLVVKLESCSDIGLHSLHVVSLKAQKSKRDVVPRTWTAERVKNMVRQSFLGKLPQSTPIYTLGL